MQQKYLADKTLENIIVDLSVLMHYVLYNNFSAMVEQFPFFQDWTNT